MNNIYIKLNKIKEENETTYEVSKMLGSPVFPRYYLQDNNLEELFFVMQINLEEIKDYQDYLPKEGYIYIFLDTSRYPYIPKVLYTNEEVIEVYDDINEQFFEYGNYQGYSLSFSLDEESPHYILGNIDVDLDIDCEIDTTGYVVLLSIDSLELPQRVLTIGQPDGWYIFLIKEEDLKKLDFSKVKFIDFGS